MAMFSQSPRISRPLDERKRGEAGGLSIIGVGMTIIGDVVTDGVVKVEGRVKGSVRASQQILLAPGGMVEGDLETKEAIIGGEVRGTVRAEDRVEVQASSVITGNIVTARIAILEGGQLNGEIKMGLVESTAASELNGHKVSESDASHNPVNTFPTIR